MRKLSVILFVILYTSFFIFGDVDADTCRSAKVKHSFDIYKGYPHGRKGFVVDHICALECGGLDAIVNMQYQDQADSLLKDRWERTKEGCALTCNSSNSTKTRQVFNCK